MAMVKYRAMEIADYEHVRALWEACEGVGLSEADSPPGVRQFLERNPGLSHVAWENDRLLGAVLCGNDGRRGYIHHLVVHPSYRRQGIASALVARCLSALDQNGIQKCHLFVFKDNRDGIAFWENGNWTMRDELAVMSKMVSEI